MSEQTPRESPDQGGEESATSQGAEERQGSQDSSGARRPDDAARFGDEDAAREAVETGND
ncbi:hypothetical protein [Georgenia sp. AZ-5]|uniref:hypothetical protein n=1 Tax=Georgenia sp. AZ-5 TaxID=3367526 RepID=UPI0037545C1C